MLTLKVSANADLFAAKQDDVIQFVNWYLRELSEQIKHTASTLAPVGRSKRLQRSMTVWDEEGKVAKRPEQKDTEADRGLTYYTGTDVFYGRFQEHGFTNPDGSANTGNPFLRPAFYAEVPKAMQKIKRPFQIAVDAPTKTSLQPLPPSGGRKAYEGFMGKMRQ